MRRIKFPMAQLIGARCGRKSSEYRMAYAIEQWAVKHGYAGYGTHAVPTRAQKELQQTIQIKER